MPLVIPLEFHSSTTLEISLPIYLENCSAISLNFLRIFFSRISLLIPLEINLLIPFRSISSMPLKISLNIYFTFASTSPLDLFQECFWNFSGIIFENFCEQFSANLIKILSVITLKIIWQFL